MRALRVLMLPIAATALLAGCGDTTAPTPSDPAQVGPSFILKWGGVTYKDDVRGSTELCRGSWTLVYYTGYPFDAVDTDGDGVICYK